MFFQTAKTEAHMEALKTALKIQFEEKIRTMKRTFESESELKESEMQRQKRDLEKVKSKTAPVSVEDLYRTFFSAGAGNTAAS